MQFRGSFGATIGLVSLILLGCELNHCTMCTRHPDLVFIDFYAVPIFHILVDFYICSSPLIFNHNS